MTVPIDRSDMPMPERPTPTVLRSRVAASSISAVARELGVSRTTVRAWCKDDAMEEHVAVPLEIIPESRPLPRPSRVEVPPAGMRRRLPKRDPWWTRVPVWIWQIVLAAALIAWAFHGR